MIYFQISDFGKNEFWGDSLSDMIKFDY